MLIKEINQDINSDETFTSEYKVSGALSFSFDNDDHTYWIHENTVYKALMEHLKNNTTEDENAPQPVT